MWLRLATHCHHARRQLTCFSASSTLSQAPPALAHSDSFTLLHWSAYPDDMLGTHRLHTPMAAIALKVISFIDHRKNEIWMRRVMYALMVARFMARTLTTMRSIESAQYTCSAGRTIAFRRPRARPPNIAMCCTSAIISTGRFELTSSTCSAKDVRHGVALPCDASGGGGHYTADLSRERFRADAEL
jgi:hypothetical protein